jgi:quercetin dioxygenase-like cupin family protein
MKAFVIACFAFSLGMAFGTQVNLKVVAKQGQESRVMLEHAVSGHLGDLNGKYKLRLSEVIYEPGGFIGEHHYAGPGIRVVTQGELTYVQSDKTTIYQSGEVRRRC